MTLFLPLLMRGSCTRITPREHPDSLNCGFCSGISLSAAVDKAAASLRDLRVAEVVELDMEAGVRP